MTVRVRVLVILLLASLLALMVYATRSGSGGPGAGIPLPGMTERPALKGLRFPARGLPRAAGLPRLRAVQAFTGLKLDKPTQLVPAPEGDGWFVLEQDGRVLAFPNREDASEVEVRVVLDLRDRVLRSHAEEGLFDIAVDPEFARSRAFYLTYSRDQPRRTVLARYTLGADGVADPASEAIVLEAEEPFPIHNGGGLAFGPDGMLYLGLGDGGSTPADPLGSAQNLGTLLGAILRIDVRGGDPYAIPKDNPFVGRDGAREEIWAYGLRNPWRFCFRPGTQEVWVGDVGLRKREEIDRVTAGANLGWPVYEGTRHVERPTSTLLGEATPPVLDYASTEGASVIGGVFYRGEAIPELQGHYVYGDYVSGRVWAVRLLGSTTIVTRGAVARVPSLCSFAEDAAGELYAVALDGKLWRFEPEPTVAEPEPFPKRLSETGIFTDLAGLAPNPGLIPYDVNVPVWASGCRVRRWVGVPDGETIQFHDSEPWALPPGSVLVQHLDAWDVKLETRVLVRERDGWGAYGYRWNAEQTDADLVTRRATAKVEVEIEGEARLIEHTFSSADGCLRCHNEQAGTVLGVSTRQLNREFAYSARESNQLRTWNALGLLEPNMGSNPAPFKRYPVSDDANLDERARAYLDVNCAPCHRPLGTAQNPFDLTYDAPLDRRAVVGVPATVDLGVKGAQVVQPGKKEASVLWLRMTRDDSLHMPPSVGAVDPHGVRLVGEWVDALPAD